MELIGVCMRCGRAFMGDGCPGCDGPDAGRYATAQEKADFEVDDQEEEENDG